MKYTLLALLLILGLSGTHALSAQIGGVSQTTINVEMIPENPKPNELVYVSLTSYATDINSALITWKVNGRTQKSGVGEKTFTFQIGGMNSKTTLSITIKTASGEVIEKTISIKPSEVDMIWQSKSYIPPFYRGKPMFSHQNEVTVIAVPHLTGSNGQEIGAKNLVYTWKKNGSVVEEASGFGKNSYTFIGSLISRGLDIEVQVYSPTSDGVGLGQISLNPQEPLILLYKKDPLYGIQFQNAFRGSVDLNNSKEISVLAAPFFFGVTKADSPELTYKWSINGVPVDNEPNETTQIFRPIEGMSGASKISLSIENSSKILQFANTSFNLRFENQNN